MPSLLNLQSESAGHRRRVAELSEKLAARLRSSLPEHVVELCNTFDEAAEFAALEGMSIAEATAAFFEEYSSAESSELALLTGHGSAAIDIRTISLPVMPKLVS